jgi:hypothetical protein
MSAHRAYSTGNIGGAVGFLASLADLLNVQLPRRPMPRNSIMENNRALDTYFFTVSRILSKHLGRNIGEIRARYGQPFQLKTDGKAAKPGKPAAGPETKGGASA